MKLADENEENEQHGGAKDAVYDIIEFLISAGAAAIVIALAYILFTGITGYNLVKPEPEYVTITSLYKEDGAYYMRIVTDDDKSYDTEIDKFDFISYKESDVIKVTIRNNRVHIVK